MAVLEDEHSAGLLWHFLLVSSLRFGLLFMAIVFLFILAWAPSGPGIVGISRAAPVKNGWSATIIVRFHGIIHSGLNHVDGISIRNRDDVSKKRIYEAIAAMTADNRSSVDPKTGKSGYIAKVERSHAWRNAVESGTSAEVE
jgi:hypothetical protein